MRILITGAMGQLGRALQTTYFPGRRRPINNWRRGEERIHMMLYAHHKRRWRQNYARALDITDRGAVMAAVTEFKPDVVIHAAAWTDTAGCERDPERAMLVNGRGAGIVAEACREAGAAMVYVSSNEVFDGEKGSPYDEDDATNAVNAYAASKLEGERQVATALKAHYIVRTSWLYGPGRVSFPEKILQAAHRDGKLRAVTDEIASPTWTLDLAGAIAKLIRTQAHGVYHFTNSGWCSRFEWAAEILRLAGLTDVPIEPATMAGFELPYRKPPFTALANTNGARLGITLRPWQGALADHLRAGGGGGGPRPRYKNRQALALISSHAVTRAQAGRCNRQRTVLKTKGMPDEPLDPIQAQPYAPTAPPRPFSFRPPRHEEQPEPEEALVPEHHEYEGIPEYVVCGPSHPGKRIIDVAAAGTAVAILWPVFALAAALIKLDSDGPVLIRQKRVGLNGREFDFFKFRTMHHHKTKHDLLDRLPLGDLRKRLLSPKGRPKNATPIGWALRKTTVDELPQLLNVVRGDMSIVGPRPDIPEIVSHWPEPFLQRHLVKPGMTGLAQVNGRSDITHYEKVRYDLEYVRDHPIKRDLRILWKTLALVASKKGAR